MQVPKGNAVSALFSGAVLWTRTRAEFGVKNDKRVPLISMFPKPSRVHNPTPCGRTTCSSYITYQICIRRADDNTWVHLFTHNPLRSSTSYIASPSATAHRHGRASLCILRQDELFSSRLSGGLHVCRRTCR